MKNQNTFASGSRQARLPILCAGAVMTVASFLLAGCHARPSGILPAAPPTSASTPAPTVNESAKKQEFEALAACNKAVLAGVRKIAETRDLRFEGKVSEANALCRGGDRAVQFRDTPWVDWSNYWGTSDDSSLPKLAPVVSKAVAARGVAGALIDLEFQRVELIKFNLFDNSGSYEQFINGHDGTPGPALKVWPEMRLKPDNPYFSQVGGNGPQECKGSLIRGRTTTGVCNDVLNPAMGSSGTLFARNVEFESAFPESSQAVFTRNRHGDRLGLLQPDPQV